jgi:hypothetical protein
LTDFRNRLFYEAVDREWSSHTEDLIRTSFSAETTSGSSLKEAVCRSTVCKLTVQHDSADVERDFPFNIATKEPYSSSGGLYYQRENSGEKPTTTIYMLRENARAPAGDVVEAEK